MGVDVKKFILTYISFITSNVKITEYVEKSIDLNGGNLIVNICNRSYKELGFKNSKQQHLYINIFSNKIYVYSENDNGYEDFSFEKDDDGITIDFNSVINDTCGCLKTVKCTEEFGKYDTLGNLLYHRCVDSKYTHINGEVATRLMCSNYDKFIDDYVIDGELVRCVDLNYHYLTDMNSKKYYISDYENDMLLNDHSDVSPNFSLFRGNVCFLEEKIDLCKKNYVKNKKM